MRFLLSGRTEKSRGSKQNKEVDVPTLVFLSWTKIALPNMLCDQMHFH
jgi:hypothetical protein